MYKAFLPAMIAANHGHLVSIASSAGLIGVNGLAGTISLQQHIETVSLFFERSKDVVIVLDALYRLLCE